jgi:type 1 fimbria pilin
VCCETTLRERWAATPVIAAACVIAYWWVKWRDVHGATHVVETSCRSRRQKDSEQGMRMRCFCADRFKHHVTASMSPGMTIICRNHKAPRAEGGCTISIFGFLLEQDFMKRIVRTYGKLFSLALVAFAALKSGSVHATCFLANAVQNYDIEQTSSVYVDTSLPAGTPLGRQGQYTFPRPWTLNCTGAGSSPVYLKTNIAQGAHTSGDVYELTVGGQPSGVGVRLSMSVNGGGFQSLPIERQLTLTSGSPAYSETDTIQAQLVRTSSPVVYGNVDSGLGIGGSNFYNGVGPVGGPGQYQTVRTGALTLVRPSCAMDVGSLNQTVNMGSYSSKDLQNPTSATPWVPFKLIVADCGDPNVLVDISFGASADQDQNNPRLFSMLPGGVTGVGIALSTDDGTDTSMTPGERRTFPGKLTGDSYGFRARLERTLAPLKSGQFSRPVTVLVVYR